MMGWFLFLKMTYYVIENRNVGLAGSLSFVETILFSGTEEEFWASLTEEQKNEKIVVDSVTYNKALYEKNRK